MVKLLLLLFCGQQSGKFFNLFLLIKISLFDDIDLLLEPSLTVLKSLRLFVIGLFISCTLVDLVNQLAKLRFFVPHKDVIRLQVLILMLLKHVVDCFVHQADLVLELRLLRQDFIPQSFRILCREFTLGFYFLEGLRLLLRLTGFIRFILILVRVLLGHTCARVGSYTIDVRTQCNC